MPPCCAGGERASNGAALGKRKAPEAPADDEPAEEAAGAAAAAAEEHADGRAGKRIATVSGAVEQPVRGQNTQQDQPETAVVAPGSKRKLGAAAAEDSEAQPALGWAGAAADSDASPAAQPRPTVRLRREQPAPATNGAAGPVSSGPSLAIGSPAPSPYRLLSPAKAGAAQLNQLPGYNFSRAAKSRRSSAVSDASTAASAGASAGSAASGSSNAAPQPLYRRKLAAPPSRLGGECCPV